jgi:hypothetical protein
MGVDRRECCRGVYLIVTSRLHSVIYLPVIRKFSNSQSYAREDGRFYMRCSWLGGSAATVCGVIQYIAWATWGVEALWRVPDRRQVRPMNHATMFPRWARVSASAGAFQAVISGFYL